MLKDKINAKINAIENHWNNAVKRMEESPELLTPDFRSLEEYRAFALENRAASEVAPLKSLLHKVEAMAESGKPENREYAKRLLEKGEVTLATEGWKAYIPGERWQVVSGGRNLLLDKLPGDGAYEATVRNAHRKTSEILGRSDW